MGYYLETPGLTGKAEALAKMHGAARIHPDMACIAVGLRHGAVICVVQNENFEAAAFCYSDDEFEQFTHPLDPRPKTWLWIEDRELVETLTGYKADREAAEKMEL